MMMTKPTYHDAFDLCYDDLTDQGRQKVADMILRAYPDQADRLDTVEFVWSDPILSCTVDQLPVADWKRTRKHHRRWLPFRKNKET